MNIPSLPTDNLYKFKALAGVFVVVAATWIGVTSATHVWERIENLRRKVAISRAENEHYKETREAGFDSLRAEYASPDEFWDFIEARDQRRLDMRKADAEGRADLDSIDRAQREMWRLFSVLGILLLWGGWMAVRNFHLWQVRVQVHLDEILRAEAGRARGSDPIEDPTVAPTPPTVTP